MAMTKIAWGRSIGWNLANRTIRRTMEITQRIYNGPDCYQWREIFAFLPVKTISGKYVWLRKVYKRKFWAVWGTGFHMEPHVEYAELFDMLRAPCEDSVNGA
mgnify:CR=1 FL=1